MNAEDLLMLSDTAAGFATMASGRTKKALEANSLAYLNAAFDAKHGPVSKEIRAMSDDELLAELSE